MEARYLDMLQHVPVFAVRTLLTGNIPSDVNLKGMRGSELIDLVDRTPTITSDMVEVLYEEYRYGGRASFYLYLFKNIPNGTNILDIGTWNSVLENLQDTDSSDCLSVTVLDIEQLEQDIDEIHFKYITPYNYIDITNEHPEMVYEVNYGFIWINQPNLYMVVMTKRETVNGVIETAVNNILGCSPSPVRLPRTFVNDQFPIEDISRGSWYDVKNDVSRTTSGEDLMEKVGDEIRQLEESSDRVAGLYREQITSRIKSKLGVHLEKGKIFLTKTISASLLRTWMYSRLHPLILRLQQLPPEDVILMSTDPLPEGMDLSARGEMLFREIASNIVRKRRNPDRVVRISTQPAKVYASLKDYFIDPQVHIFCEDCGSSSAAYCPDCETEELKLDRDVLKCPNCNIEISGAHSRVKCLAGHEIIVMNPESKLSLIPKFALQDEVARIIARDTHELFNVDEEFFWIDSVELKYLLNRHQVEYLPEDIDEFRNLPSREAFADIWDRASRKINTTKEKCEVNHSNPRALDCQQCFEQNLGRLCIPKLFRALVPDFSPTPHGGSEYGDIPIDVHLRGNRKSFIGIAKTDQTTRWKNDVEVPNKKADDWIAQIIRQAIRDQTVEIFSLVNPRPLNQEFKATVRLVAKMDNKPFVVFGRDDLTRMLCAMMRDPLHQQLERTI